MIIELYTSQVLTKHKPNTKYKYCYHYQGSKNKGYVTKVTHPPRMRYSLAPHAWYCDKLLSATQPRQWADSSALTQKAARLGLVRVSEFMAMI